MLRACLSCGRLSDGSRCPAHRRRPRHTPGRTTAKQVSFRAAVLAAAADRCQAIEDGDRCDVTGARNLEAHHLTGLRQGGTNHASNGVALCRRHHSRIEAQTPIL